MSNNFNRLKCTMSRTELPVHSYDECNLHGNRHFNTCGAIDAVFMEGETYLRHCVPHITKIL